MKHPYLTMMGLYLAAFVGMFGETALNIALPELTKAFHVDTDLMQWMVTGHMLIIGMVLPFASLLMKWFPAKRIAQFAIGTFILGSLMSGFANSFPLLLAGRLVQGIGPGLVLPLIFSLVFEVFPRNKIGAAMGICALVVMFAPAIGPTVAGFVIGALSWRWIFFLFALIQLIAFVFASLFLISPYKLTKPRIDPASCILSVLGFSGLVLGAGLASAYGWISAQADLPLVVGVVSLVLYSRRQFSMENPVLNLRAFGFRGFRVGAFLVMFAFGITLSVMFLMPQFLQRGLLLPVAITGLVLLPGGLMNSIFSFVSGKLFDKVGAAIPIFTGLALSLLSTILLLNTTTETSIAYVVACHMILLIGVPLIIPSAQTVALASLPKELSTDGSSILNTLQQVWGAVCTAVVTSLLGFGQMGTFPSDAEAFTNGAHFGFYLTLTLGIVGVIVAFRLPKAPARHGESPVALEPVMRKDVYTLYVHTTLKEALVKITEKKVSGMPVVNEKGVPEFFVSDGDILRFLSQVEPRFASLSSFVTQVSENSDFDKRLGELVDMRLKDMDLHPLVGVNLGDSLEQVCHVLDERHFRKVAVFDGEKMVGVINRSNILKFALQKVKG